ncbi:MAG: enoyl-CoA hydratase/isomerase family protein [Dehalococcoidia bacterium]|nr:enoyl-CoA hydratase/isomerase family protein [Dehalococcoidia bacterium]
MAFGALIYEKRGNIAHVILNRPQVLNSLNLQMRDDLSEVIRAIRGDDEVKVVIFSGAGRAFCAGADVTEFGTAPSPVISRKVRFERDNWGQLAYLTKPAIAAMHGFVFGSGLELAMFCDIRIAVEGTVFGLPEMMLGMIPAAGGTQTIGRTALRGPALQMLITCERIDAGEAYRIGLLNRIVPRDGHLAAAEEVAGRILANAPLAVQMAKKAVLLGLDTTLKQGMALEDALAGMLSTTRDFQIGVKAAVAAKQPRFVGR